MFGTGVTRRYVDDSSFGAFATAAAGRRPRLATTATTRKSERMLIVSPLSCARIRRARARCWKYLSAWMAAADLSAATRTFGSRYLLLHFPSFDSSAGSGWTVRARTPRLDSKASLSLSGGKATGTGSDGDVVACRQCLSVPTRRR